ncbi:replication initiation factor domain-containing protein [Neisseria shayeganii]|uniref:Replication initiation factor domain-containing protein n=1 Tax=Neisseria shayeganii TaxID=607712 RepID=A0A7D7N9Y8_9NEIS|nr:replication initiation factor domain-containing protein [Neisseria shayeganii]QMT40877.1 replication initiation factor domain-containing protein [Neisseria shayeganii]
MSAKSFAPSPIAADIQGMVAPQDASCVLEAVSGSAADAASAPKAPPASNTGGLEEGAAAPVEAISEMYSTFVMVNGKAKEIPLRRGIGTAAFIDTLSFTVSESVFIREGQLGTEDELAATISADMAEIMGYGLSFQKNGMNGYAVSWQMGSERINYGYAAFGGKRQKETVLLHFTGHGLAAALDGWETRLYQWMKERAPYAKITRVDLSHDFLNGEYTVNQAYQDWQNGGFTAVHTTPQGQCIGADWLQPHLNKGKTFVVGSMKNGSRICVIYEKGKEQGDSESPWVRVEFRMRNRDIVIDHEVLINPGEYLTGAYPVFHELFRRYEETPEKCELVKKQQEIGLEHVVKYASIQCSPAIQLLKHLGFSNDEVVDALLNPAAKLPKRLTPEAFDCRFLEARDRFFHLHQRLPLSEMEIIESLGLSIEPRPESRMQHRSMQDYLLERQRQQLTAQFGQVQDDSHYRRRTYEEWAYDRYAVPMSILNPDFTSQ